MPRKNGFQHDRLGTDRGSLTRSLANLLVYSLGKNPMNATPRDWFYATAYAVRERLIERWIETMHGYHRVDAKRVYYLSMEFLTGRLLASSLLNMGFEKECRAALDGIDLDYEEVREVEQDAALGNGGLGRLAACFLDSMATLSLPGFGYGIRYEYGLFHQAIENGCQVEQPDTWLRYGNPWEFPRPEVLYPVKFGGRVVESVGERGELRFRWVDTEDVMAMAYDTPVPGYGTPSVNNMRLWSAKASRDFDLRYFNEGNYIQAVAQRTESENLSRVLYPDDTTAMGRELRLKQQYFFVSASLQDVLRRFRARHADFDALPDKVAIQLNDTHPAVGIAELMRLLVDDHGLEWERAWDLTKRTFAYTNHTLMPEALETWPVGLFERVLPRHLQIVYEINHRFLEQVRQRHPGDADRVRRMSIVDENDGRRLRMAHLAIVGSHRVNGVSRVHTGLIKKTLFADFDALYPGRIVNVTNGVTPRRWLKQINPELSALIDGAIGSGWPKDLAQLHRLAAWAEDSAFQERFREVKHRQKRRLAALVEERTGVSVDPHSMFDVQAKRIHEYKRQLLNLLHVITRYQRIREGQTAGLVPRTVLFSGKAAPGYHMAKLIIQLIHAVADLVNRDPVVSEWLKVAFIGNYNVSTAERIVPACDLSEQISTAGTEASGTGNMKLALNGALTIGTLDGANLEMRDEIGEENLFVFGLTAEEAHALRAGGYDPWALYHSNGDLRRALDFVASGALAPDSPGRFRPVFDALTAGGDHFLLLADYAAYVACQERVDALYRDADEWARRAILNVAGMGHFSSDRAVLQYAESIWRVTPWPAGEPTASRKSVRRRRPAPSRPGR